MIPLRHPDVVHMPVADGAVLLHTGRELYFGLNGVGTRIWELLNPETRDLETLCAALAVHYPDVEPAVLRADVAELLDALVSGGLAVRAA